MFMDERFKVIYTEEAWNFIQALPEKARDKIGYNISKSIYFIDSELFKKLDGTNIWEFRTLYNGISYRLLAFWDTEEETLVVATHGFVKKTDKTPLKEIRKAEAIRKEFLQRNQNNRIIWEQ